MASPASETHVPLLSGSPDGIYQWSPTPLCRKESVTVTKLMTCGKTFKDDHFMENIRKTMGLIFLL